tara:strand:- start:504 stop:1226 length:723 start_codon:yes stop_codon:yes gene_type:complete
MKKSYLIFSFVFLGLFLFSNFAAAQTFFDPITDLFTQWEEGNLSVNVAKYLFLLLLLILIYAVSEYLPFFKARTDKDTANKMRLRVLFSVIVAILATAYWNPTEVYALLASYGAMGLALGVFIPLAIIMFFTIELGKEISPGAIVLQYFLWIAFGSWLAYKLVMGLGLIEGSQRIITEWEMIVYGVMLSLTLLMVLFNKPLRKWMFTTGLRTSVEAEKKRSQKRQALRELESEEARNRGI